MWNEEKVNITCSKCGRTRTLRSNSRTDLCPFCDGYGEKRSSVKENEPETQCMSVPVRLWSDGNGLTLSYVDNGTKIISLYNRGNFISSTNFEYWCRTHNLVPEKVLGNFQDTTIQEQLSALSKRLYDGRSSYESKAAGILALRPVTEMESNIIALSESGVPPVAIAMKFNISFAEVMRILDNIPPMCTPEKLRRSGENGKTEDESPSGKRGKSKARNDPDCLS